MWNKTKKSSLVFAKYFKIKTNEDRFISLKNAEKTGNRHNFLIWY